MSINRYQSQEKLNLIGSIGQKILSKKKVAIIGIGGLGCNVAMLLARVGIGYLRLIDRDVVLLENLQRQILFDEVDVGLPKSIVAGKKIFSINHNISTEEFCSDLNSSNASDLLIGVDLIIDCTDNLETRFLINDFCVKKEIPWIFGAAIKTTGQVMNFLPGGPCLRCILSKETNLAGCETEGVLNSLTTIIGALQSNEAIKILLAKNPESALLRFGILTNALIKIKVKKLKGCPVCEQNNFSYLDGKEKPHLAKLCGSGSFHIKPSKGFDFVKARRMAIPKHITKENDFCFITNEIIMFKDGRAIVKASDENKAKSIYTTYSNN